VEQHTNLVGSGDLLRWQRVESALLTSTNGQPVSPHVIPQKDGQKIAGARTILPIALAGEDRPSAVALQIETPTAVQILRIVTVGKIRDIRPSIKLRRNGLYITPVLGNADINPILEQLRTSPYVDTPVKTVEPG
jgi:hypothetical protein